MDTDRQGNLTSTSSSAKVVKDSSGESGSWLSNSLGNQTRSELMWNWGLCKRKTSCCGGRMGSSEFPGKSGFSTWESLRRVCRSRMERWKSDEEFSTLRPFVSTVVGTSLEVSKQAKGGSIVPFQELSIFVVRASAWLHLQCNRRQLMTVFDTLFGWD